MVNNFTAIALPDTLVGFEGYGSRFADILPYWIIV